jgi:hypothetical protein
MLVRIQEHDHIYMIYNFPSSIDQLDYSLVEHQVFSLSFLLFTLVFC